MNKEALKTRLLMVMAAHVGRSNTIGMGELYEEVFGETYNHRINDTRRLRGLITELRRDGTAICSSVRNSDNGYWLASAGSELDEYCNKLRDRAIKIFMMEAKIRKISYAELLGQLQLNLQKG